ncbi:MAG: hypothetical protein HC874_14230 [Richelia sp. SL_2_1]|nr:hypothetical protein [Richelia sp. SL_2_1]
MCLSVIINIHNKNNEKFIFLLIFSLCFFSANAQIFSTPGENTPTPGDLLIKTDSSYRWTNVITNYTALETYLKTQNLAYAIGRKYKSDQLWEGYIGLSDGRLYIGNNDQGEGAKVMCRSAWGFASNNTLSAQHKGEWTAIFGDETKVSGTGNPYIPGWSNNFALQAKVDSINSNYAFMRVGIGMRTYAHQGNNFDFAFSTGEGIWFDPNEKIGSDFLASTKAFDGTFRGVVVAKSDGELKLASPAYEPYTAITSTSSPQALVAGDNLINQGSTQATFTFNLPASPVDGYITSISTVNEITVSTISGNGKTIVGTAVTTLPAGSRVAYKYFGGSVDKWIRIQ